MKEIIDNIKKKGYSLDFINLYEYLDRLTLLEESAIIHILIFILILLTIFEIIATLFGIEIMNKLKLEKKYPLFANIFKLREQYKRFYLI